MEVARCPRCGGLWTDESRLELLYELKTKPAELLQQVELPMSREAPEWERVCPTCRFPLEALEYRALPIEKCPICQGVWLERVYLLKLSLDW